MKKLICVILVILLFISLSVTAIAAVSPVVDQAGVLSSEEQDQLVQMLLPFGNRAVQIVTVTSLEGENVEDYAEDWADSGIGVVFLLAMQERKYCITVSADYESAVDSDVIELLESQCVPYLQRNDYYGAFVIFAEQCGNYLEGYDPAAQTVDEGAEGGGFTRFLICLVIGLAAGGITAGIMAGLNRSVRPQNSAANYVRSGSMQVSISRDIYLYHHITRTEKPQSSSSSGGGSRSTRSGGF